MSIISGRQWVLNGRVIEIVFGISPKSGGKRKLVEFKSRLNQLSTPASVR